MYVLKVVMAACLFGCPIKTQEICLKFLFGNSVEPSGGRLAAVSHHYVPFRATYQLFSLPVVMSHTTISTSGPPHLTLPVKTTFLNGIFRAFQV